jgi:Fe-S cluster biogenesis protein NfuA
MSTITKDQIEEVLKKVRPFLQIDNGDVEFVGIDNENIVKVRLLGSCNGCPMSLMTLRAGIERLIMKDIPDVKRVESVN